MPTNVTFGNAGGAGTITLSGGGSWAALGYTVGQGIFVGSSTDANANGASFNGHNFYTIAAITGGVITLQTGQTLTAAETNVTVNLAAVVINTTGASTLQPVAPLQVSFGNSANAGNHHADQRRQLGRRSATRSAREIFVELVDRCQRQRHHVQRQCA